MVNEQAYRSGHNEAVLKTVWVKAHGGSNPSACAKKHKGTVCFLCVFLQRILRGICLFILLAVERRRFGESQSPSIYIPQLITAKRIDKT